MVLPDTTAALLCPPNLAPLENSVPDIANPLFLAFYYGVSFRGFGFQVKEWIERAQKSLDKVHAHRASSMSAGGSSGDGSGDDSKYGLSKPTEETPTRAYVRSAVAPSAPTP